MIRSIPDETQLARGQKPIRPIRADGNIAYVALTKGYEAIIDAADVPFVQGRNWSSDVQVRKGEVWNIYAVAWIDGRLMRMHRFLVSAAGDEEIDHEDGNGLNNRRKNLRITDHAHNQRNQKVGTANKSGLKGVSWASRDKRWRAQIQVDGQNIGLGHFLTKEAAYAAYCEASQRFHGEFGRTA